MIATIKALIASLVVGAVAFAAGAWIGWSERGDKAALEVQAATAKAERYAREETVKLNEQLTALTAVAIQETENARQANDRYHAAIRDRSVRLSIPVAAPICPRDDPAAASAPAQARAELDPEAAVALDRIANDGDDAIRALNEVIDLYNAVRERLNAENK